MPQEPKILEKKVKNIKKSFADLKEGDNFYLKNNVLPEDLRKIGFAGPTITECLKKQKNNLPFYFVSKNGRRIYFYKNPLHQLYFFNEEMCGVNLPRKNNRKKSNHLFTKMFMLDKKNN